MPFFNSRFTITQSPTYVWRYDETFGDDDEGWANIIARAASSLPNGPAGLESLRLLIEGGTIPDPDSTQQNPKPDLVFPGVTNINLGVPDLQGNDAFVELNPASNIHVTVADLSRPSRTFSFSASVGDITEQRLSQTRRPYINIPVTGTSALEASPAFLAGLPNPMQRAGILAPPLIEAASVSVIPATTPTEFDVWAQIDTQTETIGVIAIGTDTTSQSSYDLTALVRYDERIRASYKAVSHDPVRTFLITRVEEVERNRTLRLGLSQFEASR